MASVVIRPQAPVTSTLREVPFSIALNDWTSGSNGYTATVTTSHVTNASKDFIVFDGSIRLAMSDISTAKVTNGGGIVFTTERLPAGTLSGKIYTIANNDGATTVLVEDAFIIKPFTVTLEVSNASGAYSGTTQNEHVTDNMKPINIEYGTPEVFLAPVTITTMNHSIMLSCENAVGTSTVTVTLVPTQSIEWAQTAPTDITSAEADILADRIDVIDEKVEKKTLLWYDNTSASFSAQTINLNFTNYDGFEVYTNLGHGRQMFYAGMSVHVMNAPDIGAANPYWCSRSFTVANDKLSLSVSAGNYTYRDGGKGTNNSLSIPRLIYGIKLG